MKIPGSNLICPRCGIATNADFIYSSDHPKKIDVLDGKDLYEDFQVRVCRNPECELIFITRRTFTIPEKGVYDYKSIEFFPKGQSDWPESLKHEKVPNPIRIYFDEAMKCKDAGALRAAFIMLRSTLQLLLRSRGINDNNLAREIERAKSELNLVDELFDIADLQRLAGNDYAHPTEDLPKPKGEDFEDFKGWLGQLVEYLVIGPAKRNELRKRRLETSNNHEP